MRPRVHRAARTATPAHWDAVGSDWVAAPRQRLWRRHSDWMAERLVARWMPKGDGAALKTDLFDEAVGTGPYAAIRARCAEVHGIDISAVVVAAAGRRHAGLVAREGDLRDLPYEDARFDTVVSLSSLDHFEAEADLHRSLAELRRVTRPGGRLILTLDNPANPKLALRAALRRSPLMGTRVMPYGYGATLGAAAMRAAVRRAGFRVLEERAIVHCPRVAAVALGGLVGRLGAPAADRAYLRALRPFEALGRLPTRRLTAHYSALAAEAAG